MIDQKQKDKILHDNTVEYETSEHVEVYPSFESMKLREELIRGINKLHFKKEYMHMVLINHQQFNKEQQYQ